MVQLGSFGATIAGKVQRQRREQNGRSVANPWRDVGRRENWEWEELNFFFFSKTMVGQSSQTTTTTNESRADMDKNKTNYM